MASANFRKLFAEFLGTFALCFGVTFSMLHEFPFVPFVAALTVGIFVYTVGPISGAHFNPAVTLGLWSVGKMKPSQAMSYIVTQMLAGAAVVVVMMKTVKYQWVMQVDNAIATGVGEVLGAFLLVLGVCSVVFGKVKEDAAGVTVGGSLLLGAS